MFVQVFLIFLMQVDDRAAKLTNFLNVTTAILAKSGFGYSVLGLFDFAPIKSLLKEDLRCLDGSSCL